MSNKKILLFLATNYPFTHAMKPKLKFITGISFLVFLFLVIFKPFGLGRSGLFRLIKISSGLGLTCFLALGLNSIFLSRIFPKLFKDWKVYKQVLWLFWQISTVALANLFYTHRFGSVPLNLKGFLRSEIIALTFALIPISIGIRSFQNRLLEQNLKDYQKKLRDLNNENPLQDRMVRILDENQKNELNISINELLYITAADNYIEIYWKKENVIEKALLRTSLKRVEESLSEYPTIFRCHRSFVVNLKNVQSITGNSLGYKLIFNDTKNKVPVSRRNAKKLKELTKG